MKTFYTQKQWDKIKKVRLFYSFSISKYILIDKKKYKFTQELEEGTLFYYEVYKKGIQYFRTIIVKK